MYRSSDFYVSPAHCKEQSPCTKPWQTHYTRHRIALAKLAKFFMFVFRNLLHKLYLLFLANIHS